MSTHNDLCITYYKQHWVDKSDTWIKLALASASFTNHLTVLALTGIKSYALAMHIASKFRSHYSWQPFKAWAGVLRKWLPWDTRGCCSGMEDILSDNNNYSAKRIASIFCKDIMISKQMQTPLFFCDHLRWKFFSVTF